MQRSIPLLWGLVILLLILNLILLDALNLARITAIETLGKAETMLDSLTDEVIVYNIEVNQAIPVSVDIPFNYAAEIPFNTVIPVDQVLRVPFRTPAGEVMLDVPVQTDIPIDIVVPVDFNHTLSVDTVVTLSTTLPVEIDIAQTSLASYLREAKSDIARLKNRLDLKQGSTAAEATSAQAEPPTTDDAQQQMLSSAASLAGSPAPDTLQESGTSPIEQDTLAGPLSSVQVAVEARPGPCSHPYWPLWLGTEWTYNSRDSSYTQQVSSLSGNEASLVSQYEGRDLHFSLTCSPEGLGGAFLGDMRRLAEFGDLNFSNPRGVFLPRSETAEQIGLSWRQELDVSGTIPAQWGDISVKGRISRGRATATYTPIGYETVETPLGPREALHVDQKLDLELNIDFDLGGQTIPATEIVNLNNGYWFARDIGLAKTQWQGGTLQQIAQIDNMPVDQRSRVPPAAEDLLVRVCVTLVDHTVKCTWTEGFSGSDLTAPAASELEVQAFDLPTFAAGNLSTVSTEADGGGSPTGAPGDAGQSELLAYAATVQNLGQRASEAVKSFWEVALKYRAGQLTLDELRDQFSEFASTIREVIKEINQLSPPQEARAIHQSLTSGLDQCDEAIDLMDEWFDTPNSGTAEAATLLVVRCAEKITAAEEELETLINED